VCRRRIVATITASGTTDTGQKHRQPPQAPSRHSA
jgi:hypothetical protein